MQPESPQEAHQLTFMRTEICFWRIADPEPGRQSDSCQEVYPSSSNMSATMHAGGNSTVGSLLLAWSRSFSNFGERAQALKFFGWSDATVGMPCSWTGITCDIGGLMLNFTDVGLAGEGLLVPPAQHQHAALWAPTHHWSQPFHQTCRSILRPQLLC